jgi:hypothetical protein
MANASLQISVNGDTNVTEIIGLAPSDELILGVYSDTLITFDSGNDWAGWGLMVDSSLAHISGGYSLWPDEPGLTIYDGLDMVGLPHPAGYDGVGGTIAITGGGVGPGYLFDVIFFHRLSIMPMVITLFGTTDFVEMTYLDSFYVHLYPEPMTIGLLALGTLFLRRRK